MSFLIPPLHLLLLSSQESCLSLAFVTLLMCYKKTQELVYYPVKRS